MLAIGGSLGFLCWLFSLVLAYRWRATIFGGLDAWQGANWWQLWVCLLALFGGLAIMFVSLLPLRALERSNAALRRLLYGYNAVLTGLLLLAILLVLNVLVYNYVTPSFDWTESGIYTLSDKSKNILQALEKPTKIYAVLVSSSEIRMREVRALLENCRAVNEKLQVEYVAPDIDFDKMRKLMSDFQFNDRQGLIVVYGEEGKADYQIIKDSDLFANDPMHPENRFIFKGEDALMTALSYLEEGKSRPVVYFTQGFGEMDLSDASNSQEGQGLGALRERLQKGNYEVKGLQFSPVGNVKSKSPFTVVSDRVPDDAEIVVVAGPRMPLPDYALKALRDYMNPPPDKARKKTGKLVVMLDLVLNPAKDLVKTGVEDFLAEFNVKVGDNRVLSYNPRDPFKVPIQGNFGSRNPVARMFVTDAVLVSNARTIEPQKTNPNLPGASHFVAEPILLAPSRYTWVDTNLRADPGQLVSDLRKNTQELGEKLGQDPSSVVVAVGESPPPAGNDPHAFMRQQEQKPRAVVFGTASFASNPYMIESGGQLNYDLFSSTLAWLRERPSGIGLEPKKRNIFTLNVSEDVISRMRWLPATFMLITIIGLGTGVWLIRRR
ncbi:MAG TPA: Gldg family protein [Gemmataceae bacterium]|nr:Gldg family protein [Gemmataceae bacterium]